MSAASYAINAKADISAALRDVARIELNGRGIGSCPWCGRLALKITFRRRIRCSACKSSRRLVKFTMEQRAISFTAAVKLLAPFLPTPPTEQGIAAARGNPLLSGALACATRGWAVKPLHSPDASGACSCSCGAGCYKIGKHPWTPKGTAASTDEATIISWWNKWPNANIGIATGRASGVWVLDIDGDQGEETLRELERVQGELPATIEVLTGRGRHLYFTFGALEGEGRLRNKAGILPGLDVRTSGGLVVAPPSRHRTGRAYEWEVTHHPDDTPAVPAPAWLLEALLSAMQTGPAATGSSPYGHAALGGEVKRVASAPIGTRNDTVNLASFKTGQLVEAGHLPRETAEAALLEAAIGIGLPEREAAATIKSGLDAGVRKPRASRAIVLPPAVEQRIDEFLTRACTRAPELRSETGDLHTAFLRLSAPGEKPISKTRFGSELEKRGFKAGKGTAGKRLRVGLRLKGATE